MCNHDIKDLIGEAGHIRCRACGRTFKDFKEIEADRKKSQPEDVKIDASEPLPAPKVDVVEEKDAQVEKPLKKASDDKSARKAPAKKTPSKKGAK